MLRCLVATLVAGPLAMAQCGDVLTTLDGAGRIRGMHLHAGLLYLTGDALEIVDVTDPGAPVLAGSLALASTSRGVWASGTHAFVATDSGLAIVDVIDPTSPALVDELPLPAPAWSVALSGDVLFVGLGDAAGILSFDVSDPTRPSLLDTFGVKPGSFSLGLVVQGGRLMAANGLGWAIIDISEPSAMELIDESDQNAIALDVVGDLVFVPNMAKTGLFVFDTSGPIELVGEFDPPGAFDTEDVGVSGGIAVITNSELGLKMVDVSTPGEPVEACALPMPGRLADLIILDGAIAYVSDRVGAQLVVVDLRGVICPADLNGDGELNVLDFVTFQQLWLVQDAAADCDGSGVWDVLDFVCYQQRFTGGCE